MFMSCVKEVDWGMMAFVAHCAPLVFRTVPHVCPHAPCHSVTRKQRPCPSHTGRWFRPFLVIYRCLDEWVSGERPIGAARCRQQHAPRSPCQESYCADAHPSAHKSVLEPATPAWTGRVHLVNGTGNSPVSETADPRSSQTGQVIRGLR